MIFKLLSILLRYPDDFVLAHREEVAEAIQDLPDSREKRAMQGFLDYWLIRDGHELQREYTAAFDFRGSGNLYL